MKLVDARKYRKEVKRLYISAFPKEERAPFSLLMHRVNNGRDSFYAVEDNNEFVGLVYTIRKEKLVYVFFLAVVEEKRGMGYGTRILHCIKRLNPGCVVALLIEDTEETGADNYEQRIGRLGFYQANGFKQLHVRINEIGVKYELLGTEDSVTQADFLDLMKDYAGEFLAKFLYRKTILEDTDYVL